MLRDKAFLSVAPTHDGTGKESEQRPFEISQKVDALHCNGCWYPAKISEVKESDSLYMIDWEDGDTQDRLKFVCEIRPIQDRANASDSDIDSEHDDAQQQLKVGLLFEQQELDDGSSQKVVKECIDDWWKTGVFRSRAGEGRLVRCPNGHALDNDKRCENSAWICDSREKCRRGSISYVQNEDVQRFRCHRCDFDLCKSCYQHQITLRQHETSSEIDNIPIIDANKLLFENDAIQEMEMWIQPDVDCESDVPTIEQKDCWVEFRKWCTVKAQYFCKVGTTSYFEVELQRYSGCSAPQFGFCTSEFNKEKFGKFGVRKGVGDDEDSWAVDGERCILWSSHGDSNSKEFERVNLWKENDVLGFVCDMKLESSRNNVAFDSAAERYANIYVFVNGKPMNCKKNDQQGLAFRIPIVMQGNRTQRLKSNQFRLWPAFTARSMRLGYNFGPHFRYQTEIKSTLSETGISSFSSLYFSGNGNLGKDSLSSNIFQLPLINLQPKNGSKFSEVKLWKHVMGQPPPTMFKLQSELTNQELSQAVNMLLIKSQLDAVQTSSSILVLRNRVQVLKKKIEKQEKESDKKNLELIDALIHVPFIGMLTISFVLPRGNMIQIIFKLFPFVIFSVQWILLVTVGNHSLSKYNKAGGKWCLNNATSESRALMSAIAALILAKSAQRLVGLMESTADDSDEKLQTVAARTKIGLKGLAKLGNLIRNTDGLPRMLIFFIIDLGMEICFSSAVLLVNLFIVFVAEEPLDMVLNCLALEFMADLDNQMKEYLFRSWTEKDALLVSFENEMSQQLDEKRLWDAFVTKYVGEDKPTCLFTVIVGGLTCIGFIFSFMFAPLTTFAVISFGPACKPGKL